MSILDGKIKEEINNLKQSDLVQILFENNIDNVVISDPLKDYFVKRFRIEKVLSCLKCSRIAEELKIIKSELEECKKAFIKLEKGWTGDDVNSTTATRLVKKEDPNSKGQCDFNLLDKDKMGIKTSPSESYTLSDAEKELQEFYDLCKENNLSDKQIANICKPLLSPAVDFNWRYIRYMAIFFVIIAILYFLSYFETIEWHYCALARIFLIELLPIWNWKEWKNEKCLINFINTGDTDSTGIQDCTFCEYIKRIDVMDPYQPDVLFQKYIKIHKPVILEKGLDNWMKPVDFEGLLKAILEDDVLSKSIPCKFKSNVVRRNANLYQCLRDLNDNDVYFAHFQNCEFSAVKAFRKYFNRPKFLAAEILPIQYSWLLISKNYDVEKYKSLPLTDQIAIVGQFLGETHILLHPNDCLDECDSLKIELEMGEVLVFSGLWNMEYKPAPESINMAFILETH